MELAEQVAALHEQPILLPRELTKLTSEEIKNTSLKEASLDAPTYTKYDSVVSEQAAQTQPLIEVEELEPSNTQQPMTATKEGFITINLPGAYGGTGSNQSTTSTITEDDKRKRVIIGGAIILALLTIVIVLATKKEVKMDLSLDTKINTDSIILLALGIMISGAFIVAISRISKR